MAEKSLTFNVFGKDVSASKTIRGVGNEAQSMGTAFGKTSHLIGAGLGALGIAAAGTKVVDFLHDSVDAYRDAEVQQNKLEDAYKRFPKVSDVAIDSLREYNHQLSYKVGYDDDAIASSQAVIAGFDLTGKQVKAVTPLIVDYAAKTGTDLPASAEAIGKALLGNVKALKTLGIEGFKPTGDRAADLTTLIGLLQAKIGGFAEQAATTDVGKMQVLQTKLGDLEETVGGKLEPVVTGAVDYLSRLSSVFDELGQSKGIDDFLAKFASHAKNGDVFGFLDPNAWASGFGQIEDMMGQFTIWWANKTFELQPPWMRAITVMNIDWFNSVSKWQTDAQIGIGGVVAGFTAGIGRLPGIAQGAWSSVTGAASQSYSSMVAGAANSAVQIAGRFANGWNQIVAGARGLGTQFYSIGTSIVQGMINGVNAWIGRAVASVASLAAKMLGAAKAALGIHSPSRVFHDEVGAQIGAGVVAGITGSQSDVESAVANLVPVPSVSAAGGAAGGVLGGGGEVHIHFHGAVLDNAAKFGKAAYDAMIDAHRQGAIPRDSFVTP